VTLGQSTRLLISALIIVETLFLWPGIGRLFMLDIGIRTDGRTPFDFFAHPEMLAALTMVFGGLLLLSDLVASIAAYLVDPRQRQAVSADTVPA
jgi:ABC-type dipeptide/oligopeptide/nickel transport system permease component